MTHEKKSESAEFRTREDQIETMTVHYMEAGFPINAARSLARDGVAEAEARGAAEQRRKDAEGAEPVAYRHRMYVEFDDYERIDLTEGPESRWDHTGPKPGVTYMTAPLYTRPANVAALIAEAVAAERERCAKVCEKRRKTFADPTYAGGPIGAVSEMFACKACAAAIREGGE